MWILLSNFWTVSALIDQVQRRSCRSCRGFQVWTRMLSLPGAPSWWFCCERESRFWAIGSSGSASKFTGFCCRINLVPQGCAGVLRPPYSTNCLNSYSTPLRWESVRYLSYQWGSSNAWLWGFVSAVSFISCSRSFLYGTLSLDYPRKSSRKNWLLFELLLVALHLT